tara:strand:- start:6603 stop:6800 length:198 start_codon:yes stop_codon:yes gene_type:complete
MSLYYCKQCDCILERSQKKTKAKPQCPTGSKNKCALFPVLEEDSFRLKESDWYKEENKNKDKVSD